MNLPEQVSESVKRRNPHLYESRSERTERLLGKTTIELLAEKKKRLRQSAKPLMNKLESSFYETIRDRYPNSPPVRIQAKTYKLANGVSFRPDFTASLWPSLDGAINPNRETAFEVKGPHAWDDAIVKLKVAAHEWPEVQWILVTKENGQWKQQVILP